MDRAVSSRLEVQVGLSSEDRALFLRLLPALGDDADPRPARAFARVHRDELLDELVSTPGFEQVRAAALRLVPDLEVADAERDQLLAAAGAALLVEPSDQPSERIARHPAWIGLAVLELADLRDGWGADSVSRAVQLAARAFSVHGDDGVGAGEVAWAMAEQADEAGWSSRGEQLLEWAITQPFARPTHLAQVRLLTAIRRDQRRVDAAPLLMLVIQDEHAEDETRTHAAWILAHLRLRAGDREDAREMLLRASEWVDRDEKPNVAERIDAALRELTEPEP